MPELKAIYLYSSYKKFILERLKSLHGQKSRASFMAENIGSKPSSLSQVLSGDRHINPELALKISKYFSLKQIEIHYLLILIQENRTEDLDLKSILKSQLKNIRMNVKEKKKLKTNYFEIEEKDRFKFYSSWYYVGIHLLTLLPDCQDITSLSQKTKLKKEEVREVLDFLCDINLCSKDEEKYTHNPLTTNILGERELSMTHRKNWRLEALARLSSFSKEDFSISYPMAIKEKNIKKVKKILEKAVQEINILNEISKDNSCICVNIDLFKF